MEKEKDVAVIDAPDRERVSEGVIGSVGRALRERPSLEWLIPLALCAVMLAQMLLSDRHVSQTIDEPYHLYAGYRFLKCGDHDFGRLHPPLARIVAAAPLLLMGLGVNCAPVQGEADFSWRMAAAHADSFPRFAMAYNWLYSQDWQTALSRARMAVSTFAVGLCLLVWMAARRMFGLTTAIVASLLLVFEPNVLAFGSLVLTDVPGTCMMLFAVFAFYLWVRNRTFPFLLLAGLATGLTLLAKHSGVLLIPVVCLLATIDAFIQTEDERSPLSTALRNLLAVGVICVIAAGVVWGGYDLRYSSGRPEAQEPQPSVVPSNHRILLAILEKTHPENSWLLPQAYLRGFAETLAVTNQQWATFTLGKIYPKSPWFFAPLDLAIQLSAAFLVMIPLGAIGVVMAFKRYRRELLFLLVPASCHLAACMRASRMGGIRHILPMVPFLLIAVAAGCVALARRFPWVSYAVSCLIVLHAASSLHAYPNYLSYANEFWGGPTKTYKYLGEIDLGQAYLEAKDYLDRHPADPCWLLTDRFWDPSPYGVHCQPIGWWFPTRIPPRLRGTVIVSGTMLASVLEEQGQAVAPFMKEKPKDFIGGSALVVYEGDFDTRVAAGMSAWLHATTGNQALDVGLEDTKEAVALEPNSPPAHMARCWFLARTGQSDAAMTECETAIRLAKADSLHRREMSTIIAEAEEVTRGIRAAHNSPGP